MVEGYWAEGDLAAEESGEAEKEGREGTVFQWCKILLWFFRGLPVVLDAMYNLDQHYLRNSGSILEFYIQYNRVQHILLEPEIREKYHYT